jgi:hypothetical protein
MVGRIQIASGDARGGAEGVGLVATAAEQGLVLVEALWAWMLEIGSGVAKDLHAAAEYSRRAAKKGLEEAEPGLERCECWEHADAL